MTSVHLAIVSVVLGMLASYFIGSRLRDASAWVVIAFIFIAAAIGIALIFVTLFLFQMCHGWLHICLQTDDQTVWAFAYPAIWGSPIFWITMIISKAISK